jgi:hypothetical protein
LDEEYRRFTSNHRSALNSIALALIDEDKLADAAKLLNFGLATIPDKAVPYDLSSGQSVPLFFEVGEDEKAMEIVDLISKRSFDMITFYTKNDLGYDRELLVSIEMIKFFIPLLEERGYTEKSIDLKKRLESLIGKESEDASTIRRR